MVSRPLGVAALGYVGARRLRPTILLTGGTGFLGRHLLKRLLGEGFPVVLLKRTSSRVDHIASELGRVRAYDYDAANWARLFEETPIHLIVHCATNYGRGDVSMAEVVEANLLLPLQLLQLAKRHRTQGFINSDTILDQRVNPYTLSKGQFLQWFAYFVEDLACVNVALEHFYGPHDHPSKFVTRVVRDLLRGVEYIDLTPGLQKREFVYIDDVVRAFLRIIEFTWSQPRGSFRFEVGSKEKLEIRRFVELVKKLTGNTQTKLNVGALPYRTYETMDSNSDLTSLEALGWEALVSLEQGLAETIEQERAVERESP
jgi:CDP-paratose synthetase